MAGWFPTKAAEPSWSSESFPISTKKGAAHLKWEEAGFVGHTARAPPTRKQCLDEANSTVQQAFFFKDQGLGVPYQENLYIWDLCSDSSDNLRQMQRKFKNYLKLLKV